MANDTRPTRNSGPSVREVLRQRDAVGSETVIWRSKYFPELYLTKEHLEVLRYAYPQVEQFEPELRKAEAWLFVNPDRRPKKNWRRFINNWMRNAVDFHKSKPINQPQYGDASRLTPNDPRLLADILARSSSGGQGGKR